MYTNGGRRAGRGGSAEVAVIEEFLPTQMSDEELGRRDRRESSPRRGERDEGQGRVWRW